jgi:hypothetical protein
MLIIDDLLLAPITGFKFILRTLQRMAFCGAAEAAPLQ